MQQKRLFVPTMGPADWRRLLAKPDGQWRPGKSALESAVAWESARGTPRGLPEDIAKALDACDELREATLLVALPEHQVPLPGGTRGSQNDVWALLRTETATISLAVEAKAGEPLDKPVREWLAKPEERSQKPERLKYLKEKLAIPQHEDVDAIRYQLLHRTASALIEAKWFRAEFAVMIVHSFNRKQDHESWKEMVKFGDLMEAQVAEGKVVRSTRRTRVPLFLGWVNSEPAGEDRLRAAM